MDMLSFDQWLEANNQPKTKSAYLAAIRQFTTWLEQRDGDTINMAHITKLDIAQYRRFLQDKKFAPSTINKAIAALRAWFNWAIEYDIRKDNPAQSIKRIEDTGPTIAPKGLEPADESRLLRYAAMTPSPHRTETILTLLLQTGLRIGELVAANWGDIILSERSGTLIVREGKGNKQRIVPLSLTVRQALWSWAAEEHELNAPNTKQWSQAHATVLMTWIMANPTLALFTSRRSDRLTGRAIQMLIKEVARLAGLTNVTPHTMRHTCAYRLLKAGATIVEVAQILGHANISTTQIYTGSTQDHLQAAVERIGWE